MSEPTTEVEQTASDKQIGDELAKQPVQKVPGGGSLGEGGGDDTADRNYRKVREGYVVSDKMDKTVVVVLEDRKKHALYGKVMRSTKRVKAHDEDNTAGVGDRVVLMETRPLSATKRWRLVRIVEKAK
ncbi:MAG: 30S ribosomal protein S17 [Actinophytocola sp.]|nr:30S ribosomal protein S17 [Actinophytocola sp.]